MSASNIIKSDRFEYDVSHALRREFISGVVFGLYHTQLSSFLEQYPNAHVVLDEEGLRLCKPEEGERTAFLLAFGGAWVKEPEDFYPDTIRYKQKIELPCEGFYEVNLEVRQCPPPPSCKIVEEEVDVPARKEKRRRIVCPKGELAKANETEEIIEVQV